MFLSGGKDSILSPFQFALKGSPAPHEKGQTPDLFRDSAAPFPANVRAATFGTPSREIAPQSRLPGQRSRAKPSMRVRTEANSLASSAPKTGVLSIRRV
jgi:hypothetical protein